MEQADTAYFLRIPGVSGHKNLRRRPEQVFVVVIVYVVVLELRRSSNEPVVTMARVHDGAEKQWRLH